MTALPLGSCFCSYSYICTGIYLLVGRGCYRTVAWKDLDDIVDVEDTRQKVFKNSLELYSHSGAHRGRKCLEYTETWYSIVRVRGSRCHPLFLLPLPLLLLEV